MERRIFFRKFNIFVGLLILTLGIILGSYSVFKNKTGTASISQKLSQILEKNEKPVSGCQPNPNDKNKDSDNDGLKDWEEAIWKTDACIADTDKDGYLDGEEVRAGYNPTMPAPGDKLPDSESTSPRALPGNLTAALAQTLAQKTIEGKILPMTETDDDNLDVLSANYPVISAAIEETMSQSYKEFTLPDIPDQDIIISNDNSLEAVYSYAQKINEVMDKRAAESNIDGEEIFESEAQLFYESINSNNFTEIEKYIGFYQEIYQDVKAIPVPPGLKDLHKEQLGLFWVTNNIYQAIREIEIDPLKAGLALEQYKVINELTNQLIGKIIIRLQELEKE